jgi:hypothetical protein
MLARRISKLAIFGVLWSVAASATAQSTGPSLSPAEEKGNSIRALCKSSMTSLVTRMEPHLNAFTHLRAGDDLVSLVPILGFSAGADHSTGRIAMTYGMCYELFNQVEAAALAGLYPELVEKLEPYGRFLADQRARLLKEAPPGTWLEPLNVSFAMYARLQPIELSPQQQYGFVMTLVDSMSKTLAHVIGHEVAHLALKHKPNLGLSHAEAKRQEAMADRLGVDLALKAVPGAESPSAAFPLITLMYGENSDGRSLFHPPTECRVAYTFTRLMKMQPVLNAEDMPEAIREFWLRKKAEVEGRFGVELKDVDEMFVLALRDPVCSEYAKVVQ